MARRTPTTDTSRHGLKWTKVDYQTLEADWERLTQAQLRLGVTGPWLRRRLERAGVYVQVFNHRYDPAVVDKAVASFRHVKGPNGSSFKPGHDTRRFRAKGGPI